MIHLALHNACTIPIHECLNDHLIHLCSQIDIPACFIVIMKSLYSRWESALQYIMARSLLCKQAHVIMAKNLPRISNSYHSYYLLLYPFDCFICDSGGTLHLQLHSSLVHANLQCNPIISWNLHVLCTSKAVLSIFEVRPDTHTIFALVIQTTT